MPVPTNPKIYHILHVDRLPSVIADRFLWCDSAMSNRTNTGTTIGMSGIKQRRMNNRLSSQPGLHVGDCVPFYFCPRSIMLYMIAMGNNPELFYKGGQQPIIHLQADLYRTAQWAERNGKRFAFTSSNAGSYYFEDWEDLSQLENIDWNAVNATDWRECKDTKQAEFLIEYHFPWSLVERIGVYSDAQRHQVNGYLAEAVHRPAVEVKKDWYY